MIVSFTKWPDNKDKAIFLFGKCAHTTLRAELRSNILNEDRVFYETKILSILDNSVYSGDKYESSCCTITIPKPTSNQIKRLNEIIFSLDMKKNGFIRNPVERVYSAWCQRVISGYGSIPEKRINNKTFFQILGLKKKHSFLEFVQRLKNLKIGTQEYELFFNNIHFKKYSDVHSKIFVDIFLPIEFLNEIGISTNKEKHNLNRNKPITNILDSSDKNNIEAIKIAKEMYKEDMKIYNKCLFLYEHNKIVWR